MISTSTTYMRNRIGVYTCCCIQYAVCCILYLLLHSYLAVDAILRDVDELEGCEEGLDVIDGVVLVVTGEVFVLDDCSLLNILLHVTVVLGFEDD